MAGVKGRSGGARPNAGGKRAGAGRKPKAPSGTPEKSANAEQAPAPTSPLLDGQVREPLAFLELVMNDPATPLKERVRSAIAAAQYRHTKRGDGGKKEEAIGKAKTAAKGRFGARPAPLKVVGGRS